MNVDYFRYLVLAGNFLNFRLCEIQLGAQCLLGEHGPLKMPLALLVITLSAEKERILVLCNVLVILCPIGLSCDDYMKYCCRLCSSPSSMHCYFLASDKGQGSRVDAVVRALAPASTNVARFDSRTRGFIPIRTRI